MSIDPQPLSEPTSGPVRMSHEEVLARLAQARETHPTVALVEADAQRTALTTPLLEALERGLADPERSFQTEGMLFNFAAYLLAKWRELRAFPLFIRWFSLPGESALELGGDTVMKDGSRLLASVCGCDLKPIQSLILNRDAHTGCRGQGIETLAVLAGWGEIPKAVVDEYFEFLARAGLERQPSPLWTLLAVTAINTESIAAFPELRRAVSEGLIDVSVVDAARFDEVEGKPRGELIKAFAERHPPITDVVRETRWWAGFQPSTSAPANAGSRVIGSPGETYVAPAKVGRNDPCPCGSGKKYKKCCAT